MVDNRLNMSAHVTAVSRSCMFQLRQLTAVSHSISTDAAKTLTNASIGSKQDNCNSLFAGVTSGLMTKLHSFQNAAAQLISKSAKFDPVTPIIRDLHWMPVRWRADFKMETLVYKCLHGLAPPYLIMSLLGRQTDHVQVAHREDVCKLRVAILRRSWTKSLEQSRNRTANDR